MRVGFVTCVQLGMSCIDAVIQRGGSFDLLVTLRDDLARSKSGRMYLDDIALNNGIPLEKIRHINDPDAVEMIKSYDLDWLFVIGWSQILAEPALISARSGVLGMHPTLLPIGRGRASIPWAILKGLDRTGVTLFKLDGGVDTGPVLAQQEVQIATDETATSLYAKVNDAHRLLMMNAWDAVNSGSVRLTTQDESRATEWQGRTPQDGAISLSMSPDGVDRLVRATTRPYPGAFLDISEESRLRVWAGSLDAADELAYPIEVVGGVFHATDFEFENSK